MYAAEPLGSMPQHPLEDMMMPPEEDELFWLPEGKSMSGKGAGSFLHLLEVYVNDFIQLAQTKDEETLRHLSRALLHGIHSVFPSPDATGHNGADLVSVKKTPEGRGSVASQERDPGLGVRWEHEVHQTHGKKTPESTAR